MFFNSAAEELDAYYPIRPECQADVPKTRFKARVGKTLSPRRWNAAFSQDGCLDMAGVLRRIQRGGIHPTIKGAVWEFLLGCFDPNSTLDERNDIRQQRREQYAAWKAVCQKMVPAIGSGKIITTPIVTDDGHPVEDPSANAGDNNGAMSNSGQLDQSEFQWKLNLPQIGLDVVRTDRTLVYYESEANRAKLWDVLAVYAWVDKDIGYVQGMNDICSPMIILIEHEADAFWCFERAMRRLLVIRDQYDPESCLAIWVTLGLNFESPCFDEDGDHPDEQLVAFIKFMLWLNLVPKANHNRFFRSDKGTSLLLPMNGGMTICTGVRVEHEIFFEDCLSDNFNVELWIVDGPKYGLFSHSTHNIGDKHHPHHKPYQLLEADSSKLLKIIYFSFTDLEMLPQLTKKCLSFSQAREFVLLTPTTELELVYEM